MNSIKRFLLAFAGALALGGMGAAPDAAFRAPPKESHPETWFHFIGGNVAKPGITADLEAINGAGISGVQLFHGQFGSQLINRTLFLASMSRNRKGFFSRFLSLGILLRLSFIKQGNLVRILHHIGTLLTGLPKASSLSIEKDLIQMIQLLFQVINLCLLFQDCALELSHFGGSICIFLLCCRHKKSPPKTTLS